MKKFFLLMIILVTSCSKYKDEITSVSPYEYVNSNYCWRKDDIFYSFLIKENYEGKFTIFLMSPVCKIEERNIDSTFDYLDSVEIYNDNNFLTEKFLSDGRFIPIVESTNLLHKSRELYFFKGKMKIIDIEGIENTTSYDLIHIYKLNKISLEISEFEKMDAHERLKIFLSYSE